MDSQAKLNTIIKDALKVITSPTRFYQQMLKSGGFVDPVIFVLIMAIIMGFLIALLSLFGAGVTGAMVAGFGAIFIMPIFAIIGTFIVSAILFVLWRLMGSSESYETAYRCVAYATAIYPIMALIGLIPYVGSVVGVIWGMYLMVLASIEVQELNRKTTYIIFGILGLLMIVVNVSAEKASRQVAANVEGFQKQFENFGKEFEQSGQMTPEQTGKIMGELFKGLGNASNNINNNKSTSSNNMTPEEAGKALGGFLKGLEEATRDMKEQAEAQSLERDSDK